MGTGLRNFRFTTALVCITILAVMAGVFHIYNNVKDEHLSFGFGSDIEETRTVLSSMREIGQWEFLAISDEEMQDTVRRSFFGDDELVRIYYGTLRLGIDFSQCDESWIDIDGDSILLDLPAITLLDENFLDETRTQSFMESGKWSNADRKDMAERARQNMRRRCLSEQNMQLAQQNAEAQVRAFVRTVMGK